MLQTSKALKTKISQEDGKLLSPIIMREYQLRHFTRRQQSNLAALYSKYGETNILGVIYHGVRWLKKERHDPCPREFNDSFYDESEDTVDISPPPEPSSLTKLLNRRSGTTAVETPESGEIAAALIDQQITEAMNENHEDVCESTQPALKFSHWEQGILALNSDNGESSEEVEKPLVEEQPLWPTLDELVARAKAFEAARPESFLAKRPPLRRTRTPASRSSSSSGGRDQPHPAARPVPTFMPDLRQEVMWALQNPITGWESKLVHDCKLMSRRELREDLDRETWTRLHKELFRGFSPTAPAWTISQKQVAMAKLCEENDKYYAENPPEWFAAQKAYDDEKEAQRRAEISRARLAQNQPEKPEAQRKALTALERQQKRREKIKVDKKLTESAEKRKKDEQKRLRAERNRRHYEKKAGKTGNCSTAAPEEQ